MQKVLTKQCQHFYHFKCLISGVTGIRAPSSIPHHSAPINRAGTVALFRYKLYCYLLLAFG